MLTYPARLRHSKPSDCVVNVVDQVSHHFLDISHHDTITCQVMRFRGVRYMLIKFCLDVGCDYSGANCAMQTIRGSTFHQGRSLSVHRQPEEACLVLVGVARTRMAQR